MNPMPELSPMLKQLRLSGILDSLEVRNRQAMDDKMSYTEFLALLLQDETARRTNRKLNQRLRKAGFQPNKTIEAFDFTFNVATDKKLIMDLATCQFMDEKVSVLIAGPCGTGKSHIAQALGHCAVRREKDVIFTTKAKMLGQLHAAKATLTYDRKLKALIKCDLLIIDDFGLKPLQPPQDEDLHAVVAERYERKPTIVTSNLILMNGARPSQTKFSERQHSIASGMALTELFWKGKVTENQNLYRKHRKTPLKTRLKKAKNEPSSKP